MAVYFISRYSDGYLAHCASDEIQIGIVHNPKDGYLLSYDKEIIKEQLQLKEFIERIVRIEDFQLGFSYIENKVQKDMYIVHEVLQSRDHQKIRGVGEWLDERYARIIREGKLKLMQHDYSVNIGQAGIHTERETLGNKERSVTQQLECSKITVSEYFKTKYPITLDKAYQKEITDDEVYYLTTL
jgi:hypothetical protein